MKTRRDWYNDIPQQFKAMKNVEVLINAFNKQLDEVYDVLRQLNEDTEIETASGIGLDYIGDIVALTRKDAKIILKDSGSGIVADDTYRKTILYKLIRNTCDCTYEDIMYTLRLLWNTENITYREDPNIPATIFIDIPMVDVDAIDPSEGRVLAIRADGVEIIYTIGYFTEMELVNKERFVDTALTWFKYWYLDGTYALDGSMVLDAETTEEVL